MSAAGAWLGNPVAVLKASNDSGSAASALLSLAEPRYDADDRTLTFKVCFLHSSVKYIRFFA